MRKSSEWEKKLKSGWYLRDSNIENKFLCVFLIYFPLKISRISIKQRSHCTRIFLLPWPVCVCVWSRHLFIGLCTSLITKFNFSGSICDLLQWLWLDSSLRRRGRRLPRSRMKRGAGFRSTVWSRLGGASSSSSGTHNRPGKPPNLQTQTAVVQTTRFSITFLYIRDMKQTHNNKKTAETSNKMLRLWSKSRWN